MCVCEDKNFAIKPLSFTITFFTLGVGYLRLDGSKYLVNFIAVF